MERGKDGERLVLVYGDELYRPVSEDMGQDSAYAFSYEVIADIRIEGGYKAYFHFTLSSGARIQPGKAF